MPPKKKKSSKKKRSEQKNVPSLDTTIDHDEKEFILETELDSVLKELDRGKKKINKLREENDRLKMEAQQIRVETHEYLSYLEKKASKRHTTIISLSDHNKNEIKNIEDQKKRITEEFESEKSKIKSSILEKQQLLEEAKDELENLQELKDTQVSQSGRIKELEALITEKRATNAIKIQEMKSRFLKEKREFQEESEDKVQTLKNEANQEAMRCLEEHTKNTTEENRELRMRLANLIGKTRALRLQHDKLDKQRSLLLREEQCVDDIRTLKNSAPVNLISLE